jgi:hypothetical protein
MLLRIPLYIYAAKGLAKNDLIFISINLFKGQVVTDANGKPEHTNIVERS